MIREDLCRLVDDELICEVVKGPEVDPVQLEAGPQGIVIDTTRLGSELGGLFGVLLLLLAFKVLWKRL